MKYRKRNGRFRKNYFIQFFPIVLLLLSVGASLYFKSMQQIEQEFVSPLPVRAYTEQTVEPETVLFTPSPTPTPIITEKTEILSYIVEVFGDDSADIITMVRKCENSTFEQNRGNSNTNGTYDKGVLQVNSVHLSGKEFPVCKKAHDDWKSNIDCGKAIFDKYGLSAWSCSTVVGVKPFYLK